MYNYRVLFERYWQCYDNKVPEYIFFLLFVSLFIVSFLFIKEKGGHKGCVFTIRFILLEFLFFLYCTTLLFRDSFASYQYNYQPFWSYNAISEGNTDLLPENIMNVFVFIPIGLLIGMGFPKWHCLKILGAGLAFSISIEFMQLIAKRGFSETDDVIHNTLGCLLGCCFYFIIKQIM